MALYLFIDRTALFQMLGENTAGLAPLSGVVEWYVPIYVLQKRVDPGLSESAA